MTDDRLDWFPCYPDKLLGALASMKAPEGYVYVVVLLRIYESGGICRDSLDAITRRTGLNKRVVSESLDALFRAGRLTRDGDGITNPIAAKVIEEAKAIRENRKRAGAEGGSRTARKTKSNQQIEASTADLPLGSSCTPLQEQDSLFPDGKRVEEEAPGDGWPEDFVDQFWQAFPPYRRAGKAQVTVKLMRLRKAKTVTWDELIEGVRRYAASEPGEYASGPMPWLNGAKWDGEYKTGGNNNATNRNGSAGRGSGFSVAAARLRSNLAGRETLDLRSSSGNEPPNRH